MKLKILKIECITDYFKSTHEGMKPKSCRYNDSGKAIRESIKNECKDAKS